MAKFIRKVVWPHKDGKLICPDCSQVIAYHDPVYVGLRATPVHEWCAVTLKNTMEDGDTNGKHRD